MNLIKEDILKNTSGLLIHGVNCQKKMGSGIAKKIRDKWPIVFEEYAKKGKGKHLLGTFQPVTIEEGFVIGNCFTQEYYGRSGGPYADLNAIRKSLTLAAKWAKHKNMKLKMPKIGVGLGGLEWTQVSKIVSEVEKNVGIEIDVYYI